MKTYSTGEVEARRTIDGRDSEDWVPAEVAQGLYEALEQAITSMQDHGWPNRHLAVRSGRAALAAADGEEE